MNKIEIVNERDIINEFEDRIRISVDKDILLIDIIDNINEIVMFNNCFYDKVIIRIKDNINATFLEIKNKTTNINNEYIYKLGNKSKLIINKFYYIDEYNEIITINLDGNEADVSFNSSIMCYQKHQYNININHNAKKTISNIINHGVTFGNASLDIVVNGNVLKGMNDSVLNQDNKIMIMGDGKSTIKPNLYIDEDEIEARHGASIGQFDEADIFYLETRGIPREEAYYLLLNGFLLGNLKIDESIKEELSYIIKKHGR